MILRFIESAGRRLLEFDVETTERIAQLQGKVFKLELDVLEKSLYFITTEDGVWIREHWSEAADVTLRGSPIGLLQFALKRRGVSGQFFVERKVVIEGDVELAQDFQRILGSLDIDFEELLSRYIGDIGAHQVGLGFGALRSWTRDTAESVKRNSSEFLVEEARLLAPEWRVAEVVEGIDVLRADVDRLEQRVKRLRMNMG